MSSRLRNSLAQQFKRPHKGLLGWCVLQWFKYKNEMLNKCGPRLCNIKPDHKVLEIGFGPGLGIEHALEYVKDGPGKIYGVEVSTYMLDAASRRLKNPISNDKVHLSLASVIDLPFDTDTFDRVFHCNSYYFWPSLPQSVSELYRVMKPGACMVAVLSLDNIRLAKSRGFLKHGDPDPLKYMFALEASGFEDVKFEYFMEGNFKYQAIFAHVHEKPAYHFDEELEDSDSELAKDEHSEIQQNIQPSNKKPSSSQ
ncbi:uncharacterized protein LOC112567216 isoform X2 [Pomacea canaliculata]|nr:uncharacterized protein LOC112567216 isoform X2 [Pomacea canaliculata]XP_025099629.1 uncharacterized protein LOC112567216 isoform X2 [Pomacea canaliculata]